MTSSDPISADHKFYRLYKPFEGSVLSDLSGQEVQHIFIALVDNIAFERQDEAQPIEPMKFKTSSSPLSTSTLVVFTLMRLIPFFSAILFRYRMLSLSALSVLLLRWFMRSTSDQDLGSSGGGPSGAAVACKASEASFCNLRASTSFELPEVIHASAVAMSWAMVSICI